MAVRFDAAARKAIDHAMTEVERLGHAALDTTHLLVGLLQPRDGAASRTVAALDVDPGGLLATAAQRLRAGRVGADSEGRLSQPLEVAGATEQILERAAAVARERSADAVSDVDILVACAERSDTVAGGILRQAGVTPERLRAASQMPPAGTQPASAPAPRGEPPARAGMHRSGIGYDSHRLAPGGPLLLAGVPIPSDVSLVGHSDGDAVAHAVTDALLGAAAAGDIGELFPDSDEANRGRDSLEILREVAQRVRARGWEVAAIDVTVILERPKLAPHRAAMRGALARALGVAADAVSVKGKTNEGLGWIGRGEGVACLAVATLVAAGER